MPQAGGSTVPALQSRARPPPLRPCPPAWRTTSPPHHLPKSRHRPPRRSPPRLLLRSPLRPLPRRRPPLRPRSPLPLRHLPRLPQAQRSSPGLARAGSRLTRLAPPRPRQVGACRIEPARQVAVPGAEAERGMTHSWLSHAQGALLAHTASIMPSMSARLLCCRLRVQGGPCTVPRHVRPQGPSREHHVSSTSACCCQPQRSCKQPGNGAAVVPSATRRAALARLWAGRARQAAAVALQPPLPTPRCTCAPAHCCCSRCDDDMGDLGDGTTPEDFRLLQVRQALPCQTGDDGRQEGTVGAGACLGQGCVTLVGQGAGDSAAAATETA